MDGSLPGSCQTRGKSSHFLLRVIFLTQGSNLNPALAGSSLPLVTPIYHPYNIYQSSIIYISVSIIYLSIIY